MRKLLPVIILAGLALRLYGTGHGLAAGRVFHPDTRKQMLFFEEFLEGNYRIRFRMAHRDFHGYPAFHMHITEWAYRGARFAAGAAGCPRGISGTEQKWFFARVLTALFSAAAIPLVFAAGKELFSEKAGIYGAALFAVQPFSVGMSHFIMGDTAMTFFAVAAFYVFCLCYRRKDIRLYALGGLAAGFAAACKYNGAFILIPGVLALPFGRFKKTFSAAIALLFGVVLGFTVGNPSMFTHFSEGVRGALAFLGYVSGIGWDASRPRVLAALAAVPGGLSILRSVFGIPALVVFAAALARMFRVKRNFKTLFAASFPVSYFVLSLVSKPYPRALYMLVLTPFVALLTGWFLAAEGRKKPFGILPGLLAALLLGQGLYASYSESFLFSVGDTRISAAEWLERNVPSNFRVDYSRYSVRNMIPEFSDSAEAGAFFTSSGLAGFRRPPGGVKVREFSHEDKTPAVVHRNPDMKILAYFGDELKPGFRMPVFNRMPFFGDLNGPLFINGAEFGRDPFRFFLRPETRFTVVSYKPLEGFALLLSSYNVPARVSARAAGRRRSIELEPFAVELVEFRNPVRRPPFNRYYYDIKISSSDSGSRVFGRLAFSDLEKGLAYFEAGRFEEAAFHFGRASDCFVCPVEVEIMRAYSYNKAGMTEEAARSAGFIRYWAEDFEAGREEACFAEVFLENTGISTGYLEQVNAVKIYGNEFASARGRVLRSGKKGEKDVFSHVIECGDGERALIFGPYLAFPPGNYFARFLLRLEKAGPETGVSVDVSARTGEEILAAGDFKAGAFPAPGELLLPFAVEGETAFLEFRSALSGSGELILDYVEVFPDVKKNTLEKARLLESLRGAR